MFKKLITLIIPILIFNACEAWDKDETIPSYLYIAPIQMNVLGHQGTANQAFKDAWVFVDSQYVGAYELPASIPVLNHGRVEVKIFAGIRNNGSITNPIIYPMTDPYITTVELEEQKTDTVFPKVHYSSDIVFPFIENFDHLHYFNFDKDNNQETKVILSSASDAFEGSNSGLIELTSARNYLEAWFDYDRPIPYGPNSVYIELNYKSTIPFNIGLVGFKAGETESQFIDGVVLPKSSWNKVYFEFKDIVNNYKGNAYRVALAAFYINDTTIKKQEIFIDNIKVLHR